MAKNIFTTTMPVLIGVCGDEIEITASISYQLHVGCPASMDGPAEDASVEILDITLLAETTMFGSRKTRPFVPQEWLTDFIRNSDRVNEALLEDAAENMADHADRIAEAKAEARAEAA